MNKGQTTGGVVKRGSDEASRYHRAFAPINAAVPHRQGFDETELALARAHPQTLWAPFRERPDHAAPIVTSLDVHEWVSGEFFAATYPQLSPNDIFHLCSNQRLLEQLEHQPLIDWFRRLPPNDHLLITDFPVHDGAENTSLTGLLPSSLTSILDAAGMAAIETTTIGVQHYFDGVVELRDRSRLRDGQVDLAETYRRGLAEGRFQKLTDRGVRMVEVLEDDAIEEAWACYETYIASLNLLTPILESLDRETFEQEMKDPEVHKFVSIRNGRLKCMMFISSNLTRYSWLSPTYLTAHRFQEIERGSLFEFPCLFTTADARGLWHVNAVFRLACQLFELAGIDAGITFDCPAQTHHSVKTVMTETVNRGTVARVDLHERCQQRFVAFKVAVEAEQRSQPAVRIENPSEASWNRFDPGIYVADNYLSVSPEDRIVLEGLAEFYADLGDRTVRREDDQPFHVVEIGGGPNLYPVLAALALADRITIVERGARNIAYLTEQLSRLSPNWLRFWDELAARNPAYRTLGLTEALAGKVRVEHGSLFDFRLPGKVGCDVVSSHFCIESITSTREGFRRGLASVAAMTKPGGHLVASFLKGAQSYTVGPEVFPAYPVFEDDLVTALEDVGYHHIDVVTVENSGMLTNSHEWLGMIVVAAQLRPQGPEPIIDLRASKDERVSGSG